MNLFSLENKVALITGATGVLGTAMCRGLAQAGAQVVLLARKADALKKLKDEIGDKAMTVQADVLKEEELRAAHKKVHDTFGPIDILVNTAGGNQKDAVIAPDQTFFDLKIPAFQDVVDLNLTGTVLPTQIFGKDIIDKKRGVIVNISSMAAYRPLTRVVGYAAAKAAVTNFTEWLAVELATKYGEGIRVNAIAPGFFLTEQNRELLTNKDGSLTARGNAIVQQTPFKRFGNPDELVGTLIWLCSNASKFVSGTVIPVDGGFNAYSGV